MESKKITNFIIDKDKTKEQLTDEQDTLIRLVETIENSDFSNKSSHDKDDQHQKLLESDLKQLKELFNQVESAKQQWESSMDCISDMVILIDDNDKIKRCNKAFKEFTGKSYEEIINSTWDELALEYELKSGPSVEGDKEIFHKQTGKWFLLNSYSFQDNNTKVRFTDRVITIHDNTEIKNVTEELIKKNQEINKNRINLKSALDEVSSLMECVTKDKQCEIESANPNLEKCYEIKNCEREDCSCYGQEPTRCWQRVGTFCDGGVQGTFADKYITCTDCEVLQKATIEPIHEMQEQFHNMMHVLDIKNKELKNAYEDLKAAQAQILQQDKMASIGQLAAGVAHEINNPMGFISSNIRSLNSYMNKLIEFTKAQGDLIDSTKLEDQRKLQKRLKINFILEDIPSLVEESLDGAERIKSIVQNLKSFSRVDEADCKAVDINECIESTLTVVRNELKYKATLQKDYGEIPLTKCFPQQLSQVFMNLFINSEQAIEKQGEIRIKTWNDDGSINISISDSGCGIPEDKINRIFEPFFTTKDVGKGTGLGLSIVYNIIKNHDGEIRVNSEEGVGTTFNITLPIHDN